MSDPMDEMRESFFVEAEELLEALQDGLAQVEAGDADAETINVLFRAVHSIKGGAGAFHLTALVDFAHIFETALDSVRAGEAELGPDTVKLHYQAADLLADLVRASREGSEVEPERLMPIVDALEEIGGGADDDEVVEFSAAALSIDLDLDDAAGGADPEPKSPAILGFVIRFAPSADLYANGNEPLFILRAVRDLGQLSVRCEFDELPTLDAYDPSASHLSWYATLETDEPRDAVEEIFEFVEGHATVEIDVIERDEPDMAAEAAGGETEFSVEAPADPAPGSDPTADVGPDPDSAVKAEPSLSVSPKAPPTPSTAPPPPAAATAKTKPSGASAGATVRVELARIDRLVNLVGELVINQAMLAQSVDRPNLPANSPVAAELDAFLQLTRDIQDSVMMIRAQPVKPLFQRMGRIVREAAAATGKEVRFTTEGDTTEIDKTVIERLADPLTHMIRNAVDHGLEKPDARAEAGKSAEGEVRLTAAHRSGRVAIDLSDDGAGINRPRVLEKAIERGLVPAGAELSDGEIDALLFQPGFSTSAEISNLSGRGVGMDVVRNAITALGGRISIASTPGKGTVFSISLPLTLALMDGMIVRAEGELLVIPLGSILETTAIADDAVRVLGGDSRVLHLRDHVAPIIDLAAALGYRAPKVDFSGDVAILIGDEERDGGPTALVVDAIEEQRQVVIKGLESSLTDADGVAAATILGDGRVALILDPIDLITGQASRRMRRAAAADAQKTEALAS